MDTVIHVLCPECHGPDTVKINAGGNPHAENALYGCNECGAAFVSVKLETTTWTPTWADNDTPR